MGKRDHPSTGSPAEAMYSDEEMREGIPQSRIDKDKAKRSQKAYGSRSPQGIKNYYKQDSARRRAAKRAASDRAKRLQPRMDE